MIARKVNKFRLWIAIIEQLELDIFNLTLIKHCKSTGESVPPAKTKEWHSSTSSTKYSETWSSKYLIQTISSKRMRDALLTNTFKIQHELSIRIVIGERR